MCIYDHGVPVYLSFLFCHSCSVHVQSILQNVIIYILFFLTMETLPPKKTLFHICNRSIAKDHIFLFTLTHLAKSSGREPTFFIKVAESPPSTYSITIHRCFWNIHSYHSHSLDICMRHSTLLSINFLPIFILNHSNSYF